MDPALVGTPTRPKPLARFSHLSFIAADLAATHRFYHDILRLPLVYAARRARWPHAVEPAPHIEVRYALADGCTLNFVVFRDGPPEPLQRLHPLRHFALRVRDAAAVELWARHLAAHGVAVVGPVNHGIVLSVYFHDPNEIRLELTADLVPLGPQDAEQAVALLAEWQALGAVQQRTPIGGHRSAGQRGRR